MNFYHRAFTDGNNYLSQVNCVFEYLQGDQRLTSAL